MSRILLFDWTAGGHHHLYLERFARAMPPNLTPVIAAPESSSASLQVDGFATHSLGDPRPGVDAGRHLSRAVRDTAREEMRLLRAAIDETEPQYTLHMFADGLLRTLVRGPELRSRVTLLLFRPRAHYPKVYVTPLSHRERLLAEVYEALVWRWRRRPEAHAVMTLDEGAAARWSRKGGAPAIWVPEPPVATPGDAANDRRGATLFGSLAPRKGIDRLVAAAALPGQPIELTLAGTVVPAFSKPLSEMVRTLEAGGATLTARFEWHCEDEVLRLLGEARCVVLPYVNFFGMSRVLLEAAVVGTPVIVHNHGLLGSLVKRYGIGLAVDLESPSELRNAMDVLCHDDTAWLKYHEAAAHFAQRYSAEVFATILAETFEPS